MLLEMAAEKGVPAKVIGRTGGKELVIRQDGQEVVRLPVQRLFGAWKNALPEALSIR